MHPKFKFQNGGRIWKCSLKQSCRVWKVEQLSFLEIFNFFRKFESNLQNELGGNSVISRNSSPTTAPPPASFLRPSRRVCDRPWLRAGTGSTLRVESARSWPRYKAQTSPFIFLPSLCFSDAAVSTPASFSHLLSASKPRKSRVLVPPAPRTSDRAIATAWVHRELAVHVHLPRGRRPQWKRRFTVASFIRWAVALDCWLYGFASML